MMDWVATRQEMGSMNIINEYICAEEAVLLGRVLVKKRAICRVKCNVVSAQQIASC